MSLYNPRRHVGIHAERVSDVADTEFPGHYPNEDHSWDLQKFKKVITVISALGRVTHTVFVDRTSKSKFNDFHNVLLNSIWLA